jgi:hypothetical protein
MSLRTAAAVGFAAVAMAFAGQAAAEESARIEKVDGSVLVSQGGRYVPAKPGMLLRVGDRVITTKGTARLSHSAGCALAVGARSMATIKAGAAGCADSAVTPGSGARYLGPPLAPGFGVSAGLWSALGFGQPGAVGNQPNSP